MRGRGADPRQAERLGDGRHDGDGAVGGHGEHAVGPQAARRLDHRFDVAEVHHLACIGEREPRRLRFSVDRGDAQAGVAGVCDRPALVPARTDEQDGSHVRRDATCRVESGACWRASGS